LQAKLTTYYVFVVQGARSCHKTRIVKHRFEDQEDDKGTDTAEAAAAGGAADASASAADAGEGAAGARASCCTGREVPAAPAQAPSPVGKAGALGAKKKMIT
jgi:hypothetical protein